MQAKTESKIGIVILTYNSASYITGCLNSVLKNVSSDFICVVVDNYSTDQTIHIVQDKFSKVTLIRNIKNLGYAAGNNIGIRYLLKKKVDYILLLNPDTAISPALLNECSDLLSQNKHIGIVGPIITYMYKPDIIWFAGGELNRLFMFTKHSYMNKKTDSFPVDFITGACMMIRADMLKKTGFLPEEYFLYFEDVFFCQKVREKGYICSLLPKPLARHAVSTSTGTAGSNVMSPLRAYYFARNPLIYIQKEIHGIRKLTNYFGQCFIRFPYYTIQCMRTADLSTWLAYLRGVKDGLLYKPPHDK